jgi:hypothetical protein
VAGAGDTRELPRLQRFGTACLRTLERMVVISSWSVEDPPQRRVDVVRELLAVWAVHAARSYRLIRQGH